MQIIVRSETQTTEITGIQVYATMFLSVRVFCMHLHLVLIHYGNLLELEDSV